MKKYRITRKWSENGKGYYGSEIFFEDCIEHAHVHFYNQVQTRELELGAPAEMINPNFFIIKGEDVWKLTEL